MDVGAWLRGLGLGGTSRRSATTTIDAEVLPRLTADDLKDMGVTVVGHRRKLLDAIAALRASADAPPPRAATADTAPAPSPTVAAPAAQAERRQLTVMFVDLVGSTQLSTRLDPEEMREVLRAYQDTVAGVVARFEGVVAKFMGDGVLAYFGFPRAHEDDAERAVRAGLAIVDAVGRLRSPDGAPLGVRVGIATGLVVVGDLIGSGPAQEHAVVGETPNLAARLQALAEPGAVVIAPVTHRLVGGLFEYADLGDHPVKGFAEPIRAWRVLGPGRAEGRFEALRGAARALGRPRAGDRTPARPLGAGQGGRGPGRAAVRRARHRQIPARAGAARAAPRRAPRPLALLLLAAPHGQRAPPGDRATRARRRS